MTQKIAIFTTNLEDMLQLVNEGIADASVSLNPSFSWAKFILTDDQANENKQRIPKQEFSNLIKTGVLAPIKMEVGDPNGDHANSTPLGVISHLKEVDNRIEGLAALWTREREEDVTALKEMYKGGRLPQLSWEVMYEESQTDDSGIEDLLGTALRAVTIVGMPAYAGRTPIVALASKNETEDDNVDELEQSKARITELEQIVASKDEELTTIKTQMTELQSYKDTAEKEKADIAKLASIRQKFSDSGLSKEDTYFVENKERLLSMPDETLDFVIQEMVSFSRVTATSEVHLPPIVDKTSGELSIKEIAERLRQEKTKK